MEEEKMIGKLFHGGIHPPTFKDLTAQKPIKKFPSPDKVYLPLLQHTGTPLQPLVKKGDLVKRGQKIADADAFVTAPLHSPIAGKVLGIEECPHPTRGKFGAIVIENSGSQEDEINGILFQEEIERMDPKSIQNWIREGGFVGLGGAAFPTHVKVSPPSGKKIDTLIINGAECEPFITCDHRVMMERTDFILTGAYLLARACGAQKIIFGIEKNKPDCIEKITGIIHKVPLPTQVFPLPVLYPQGSEKHLILTILGKEVPPGGLPLDVQVVVSNVQTAWAIGRKAQEGIPLIERIITLTGNSLNNPENLDVPIGVRLLDLVDFCGGFQVPPKKTIMGGPMTGIAQVTLEVPVVKGTSGFVFFRENIVKEEYSCIRCGRCVDHCPMYLLPTDLFRYAEYGDFEEAKKQRALDCIECGSCSYVCPAGIPITHYIKIAKAEILLRAKKGGK
jgi:electron transport complex protein RnfC